jgi:hypothetical protein
MANVHHKPIKKFSLDGNIHDDSAIWRLKYEYIRLLTIEMRLQGYVPRIDINPDFTIQYNSEKDYFEFEISVYGIYVGKRQSEWIAAVDETKPIYMEQPKSEECSQEQV